MTCHDVAKRHLMTFHKPDENLIFDGFFMTFFYFYFLAIIRVLLSRYHQMSLNVFQFNMVTLDYMS